MYSASSWGLGGWRIKKPFDWRLTKAPRSESGRYSLRSMKSTVPGYILAITCEFECQIVAQDYSKKYIEKEIDRNNDLCVVHLHNLSPPASYCLLIDFALTRWLGERVRAHPLMGAEKGRCQSGRLW